jgi:hypothetical protein
MKKGYESPKEDYMKGDLERYRQTERSITTKKNYIYMIDD